MIATTQQTSFITQTKRMLAYWQKTTVQIDLATMALLEAERHNLFHAVQLGLRIPDCGEETAVILSQAIPFIAQRGYWQEWNPLLRQCLKGRHYHEPTVEIDLLIALGRTYRLNSQADKAIETHEEARRLAQAIGTKQQLGTTLHDLLEDYNLIRDYEMAERVGLAALDLLKSTADSESLLANCYKMLGSLYFALQKPDRAEEMFTHAVSMWRERQHPIHLARTLNDFSLLFIAQREWMKAESCLIEAASLLASTINELDKCMIQINLSMIYSSQQQWAKAEAALRLANSTYIRQSVALSRKARVNNNLGYVLFRQDKYVEAEEYLKAALVCWQEIGDDLEYANSLSSLADCFYAQGKVGEALPLYDQLLLLLAQYPTHPYAQALQTEYSTIRQNIKKEKEAANR